jgi:hypothetical protein
MRKWMKVFVLCLWTLTICVIGNTMSCMNQGAGGMELVKESVVSQEQVVAQDTSHDIQSCINYLLSSRYADLLQHSSVYHSGSTNDFKFLLRSINVLLFRQTDSLFNKLYKLTHSTHPYMGGSIDYYIYTLERILI